ncbi:dipeptidase PepE [Amycolatopsis sp. GM8]|uniref:dipeptidase PepE n=1 Tax=Amycolatopsis sp. GM8 TaxID=2896530 RepID=UPI001F018D44|nr:dipeptidase PepE [Amycolatopsis sp. GM8]
MRLLLMSNAKREGLGYLEHAQEHIGNFLPPETRTVLFVPYAAVTKSYDQYVADVTPALAHSGRTALGIHTVADPVAAMNTADAIMVGGGNTWRMLSILREQNLLDPIRARVRAGVPYLGWSAGTNLTCPTIMTTNDMPIVDPGGMQALNLIPFQINPHYLHGNPPGFKGETRQQRIDEYLQLNRDMWVAGLREGLMFRIEDGAISLHGIDDTVRVFGYGQQPVEIGADGDFSFLLSPVAAPQGALRG